MSGPFKIRAELQVNGGDRTLVLMAMHNEKPEHLALKLAAYLSFWEEEMTVDAGASHPALAGGEYLPDLLAVDAAGQVSIWVECGNTTLNKLAKVQRRWPDARLAVFKEDLPRAQRLRADLEGALPRPERVEIFCWPGRSFAEWMRGLSEKTHVCGEAGGGLFNLVVNEKVYTTDLVKA